MRLPPKPMPIPTSKVGALNYLTSSNVQDAVTKEVSSADDSFDDENGENQPGFANVPEIDKRNEVVSPMIKPSGLIDRVSLVESRAAMFGNVNSTQKRRWSKPSRMKSDSVNTAPPAAPQTAESSVVNHDGVEDSRCKQQEKQSDTSLGNVDRTPAENTTDSSNSSTAQLTVNTYSRINFDSKNRFISTLVSPAHEHDAAWIESGRHLGVMDTVWKKDYKRNDNDASGPLEFKSGHKLTSPENEESVPPKENSATSSTQKAVTSPSRMDFESKKRFIFNLANSTRDTMRVENNVKASSSGTLEFKSGGTKNLYATEKGRAGTHMLKNESFDKSQIETTLGEDCVSSSICINQPKKSVSPAQEETEKMPSPSHQLRSSQMKLKTHSICLKKCNEAVVNADNTNEMKMYNIANEEIIQSMKELNDTHSAFINSVNSTVGSPETSAGEVNGTVTCSPIPHLLKPTRTKFKSTYTDILMSKLGEGESIVSNLSSSSPKESFASRFSDVHVPPKLPQSEERKEKSTPRLSNEFPANFSDTVSSQTTASSSKNSPALTRFLYLKNTDKDTYITSPKNKSLPKKIIDVTTDAEAIPRTNQVFSPLTSQLLTDMIGFTTSFSEVVASPNATNNEDLISSNDQSMFSDFSRMNCTSLSASDEIGSHGAKSGSPFSFGFTSSCEDAFTRGGIDFANNAGAHFADFGIDNECVAPMADTDADKSDDLGRELDSILETPEQYAGTQSKPLLTDVVKEEPHIIANDAFFGARYNQELGSMDAIANSISQGSQIEETLSTIDEADEDLDAQLRLFKDSLTPGRCRCFNQIHQMFDRKIENLEQKVKSAAAENSVINEEMCHQHRQIQSLMTQNQILVLEVEKLKKTATDMTKSNSWGRFKKKTKKKKHWI